jgi:hypothetical protein
MADSGYNLFVPHINRKTGQPCEGFVLDWSIPTISFNRKEVNMTQLSQEWFMEMARLIKARDHALQMVERWQVKAKQAEESIATLSEGVSVPLEPATEPEPVQE